MQVRVKPPTESVMLKQPTPTSVTVTTPTEQVDSVVVVVIGVSEHPLVAKDEVVLQPVVKTPPEIVVL